MNSGGHLTVSCGALRFSILNYRPRQGRRHCLAAGARETGTERRQRLPNPDHGLTENQGESTLRLLILQLPASD